MTARTLLACLVGAVLAPLCAQALAHDGSERGQAAGLDEARALEYSQAAIGRTLDGFRFADENGREVSLDAFRGKPLVVSLIYTSCYHVCPMLTQTLDRAVDVAAEAVDEASFAVVTIGFDAPTDTPARMGSFARQQGIERANWRFLSADATTIEDLSAALGFLFYPSAKGFDHLAQTSVVDAEGKVFRHIYGDAFAAPLLVEPLKDLVFGTRAGFTSLSGLVNQVRLFCTIYDPSSERYRFDYSIFIGMIIGFASLATVGFVLVRAWLGGRRPG